MVAPLSVSAQDPMRNAMGYEINRTTVHFFHHFLGKHRVSVIDNAMIDNDGYLILTMTDGTTINAGLVRDTSAVANKEANDSATAKSLATAAVGLSGASLLWNIAMLALSITMKRKKTTFHR